MTTDLKDQIHILMERGIASVTAAEAASQASRRSAPFRLPSSRRRRTLGISAAGLSAAACAVALVVTQAGGVARTASQRPTIVTEAYVRHLASASRIALARSGRAVIVSRQTLSGVWQGTNTDDIAFSGRNWNDSFSEILPPVSGQPATTQSAINRVVNGQAYDYFVAAHGLAWYHDVGPDAIASMAIPDARTLLSELSADADFVVAGYSTVDGVRLEHLLATNLAGLPALQLGNATPQGRLTSLSIWADSSGVVHRMSLTTTQTIAVSTLNPGQLRKTLRLAPARGRARVAAVRKFMVAPLRGLKNKRLIMVRAGGHLSMRMEVQDTSVVVSFLDIGQPQVITVPGHAYLTYGLG